MKTHFRKWSGAYLGSILGTICGTSIAIEERNQKLEQATASTNAPYGLISVFTTTNFVNVEFKPVPCPHPGCDLAHSFQATERYMTVRDTWAEVVGTGQNKRLHSVTNDWGSLVFDMASPTDYRMHTMPGFPVRPGVRWPTDQPPLPPWEQDLRRSMTAGLPAAVPINQDTNNYGVLYNVTANHPGQLLVLERRGTDRLSGVRVFDGDAVERITNSPTRKP